MKIKSILNNSALITINEKNEEIILLGKGISFQKHPGDDVDASRIEKIFKMNSEEANNLIELLQTIPEKYFEITNVIVRYANKKLNNSLNKMIYITLFDHINSAIERYNDNINLSFGMLHEIQILYPEIYLISEWAVDYLNAAFDIELKEEECGFISIHLINALSNEDKVINAKRIMKIVKTISDLIKDKYGNLFETEGVNFSRFLTHLKYFAVRYLNHNQINDTDTISFIVPEEIEKKVAVCISEINQILANKYKDELSEYESSYLVLHLCRLIKK